MKDNKELRVFLSYFLVSCVATLLDFMFYYLSLRYFRMSVVLSNTLGIIVGFLFQNIFTIKYVFKIDYEIKNIIVFILTFMFGLNLSDIIIFFSYEKLKINFFYSKILAIVIPFFILYKIRKLLLYDLKKEAMSNEKGISI